MKSFKILATILLIISLGLTSCNKKEQPSTKKVEDQKEQKEEPKEPEKEEEEKEEETPMPVGFEGYAFALDQNPSKESGWYQYHSESPQAKIVAISPDGKIIRDFLEANEKNIELGYDCSFQLIDDHMIVFARKLTPNTTDNRKKVTVINTQSLEFTQIEYSLDGQVLATAVNHKKAFLTDRGSNLHVLDLTSGNLEEEIMIDSDPAAGYAVHNDELFMFNSWNGDNGSIDYINVNDPNTPKSIEVEEFIEKIAQVSETMLLAKGKTHNYLISLETKKVEKKFTADLSYLFLENAVFDASNNKLYAAGNDKSTRDKIFSFDLTQDSPERIVFLTIPAEDLSKMSYRGNTKICINSDKKEMYVGYLSGKAMIPNNSGGQLAIRVGYLGSISLEKPAPHTNRLKA